MSADPTSRWYQDHGAVEGERNRLRDEMRGVAQRWMARTELAEAEANRLRAAIEEYRMWEPGKAGHAAAHARLMDALKASANAL